MGSAAAAEGEGDGSSLLGGGCDLAKMADKIGSFQRFGEDRVSGRQ